MESICLVIVVSVMGYHVRINRRKDDQAFFLATLNLTIFMGLALIRRFSGHTSDLVFVPLGFFIYVVILVIILQSVWKNMIRQEQKAVALENDMRQLEISIDAQKQHNELLIAHANEVKEQRHDLRHHLLAIGQMVDEHHYDDLRKYVQSMTDNMPVNHNVVYCDHVIINSLLSYYKDCAEKSGIRFEIQAQIPAHFQTLPDNVLSVIVGNLVENAIQACKRMDHGDRYVVFQSKVQGDMLVIAMHNSFNGVVRKRDDRFVSSKVADGSRLGTGLASVTSLASKYQGETEFYGEGDVFYSSVYLKM